MTFKVDGTNGLLQAYDYQVLTTGFSYTFAAGTQVLLVVPVGTLDTGTVTMPSTPADGMNITISSTQQITALTVNANTGQSIVGGGASYLPANGSRTFVYRLANTTWYPQAVAIPQPLTDIQTFNAGDADLTWDKPTGGQTMCRIQLWGGGGGGNRQSDFTAAGGGGGYNEIIVPLSYMDSTATITVGAAGVGRTASTGAGTAGGFSRVIVPNYFTGSKTLSAYGGGGGATGTSRSGIQGGGGTLSAGTTNAAGSGYSGLDSGSIGVSGGWGGAGGGTYATCANPFGGSSLYGGGGGTSGTGSGGASLFGGSGGNRTTAGTTPAGGGGSANAGNVNGTDGGAGRVIITSW
jgi:hypothetical protein